MSNIDIHLLREKIAHEVEQWKEKTANHYTIEAEARWSEANFILGILDSLHLGTLESEKPMNQDGLEEEMEEFFETMPVLEHENIFDETFQKIARHFAEWGAEHLRDSTKMIDKSLEEAAEEYSKRVSDGHNYRDVICGFIAGAEWQKQQFEKNYKEIFNDYWTRGFEEGRADMKEEMLKDAIPFYEILKAVPSFERENTRIIIVKEEE